MKNYPQIAKFSAAVCALALLTSSATVFAADEKPGTPDELAKEGEAAKEAPVKPNLPPEKKPPVVQEGPTDGRVLPPQTNKLLEAAFGRMAPEWTLKEAKIEKKTVKATLCDAQQACVDLDLSDPKADCKGSVVGPWCVTWSKEVDAAQKTRAHDELAKDSDDKVWTMAKHKSLEGHKPGEGGPDNAPEEATATKAYAKPATDAPAAEVDDPSLLLLLAAAFGMLIAAIALFRMKGDDDDAEG